MLLALLALALAAPAHAGVRVYDVPSGTVRTFEDDLYRWTPDGAGLLVSRGGTALRRIDLATGTVAATPEPKDLAGPLGHWISIEFDYVALHAPDGRELARFRTSSGLGDTPDHAWTRDGTRLAVATDHGLWVVDTATGQVLVHRTGETYLTEQAFAPDGSAVLVTRGRRVLRVDVPSGRVTPVYTSRELLPPAAWSAAGRIAITTDRRILVPGARSIRVDTRPLDPALWSADGGTLRFFLAQPEACSAPAFGLAVAAPGEAPRILVKPGEHELGSALWSPVAPLLAVDVRDVSEPARGKRRPWPKRIARHYSMYTARGDAAMRRLVVRASRSLRRGDGREQVLAQVRLDFARVAGRFAGAQDTAVRERLADELDRWLVAAGFEVIEALDEVTC